MATDFQKKRKSGRIHHIAIAAAALGILAICIMLVVANLNIYKKKQQLNTRIQSLKTQISDLQKENTEAQQGIASANDSAYIEKVAREQLDLQKPGETVVSFVQNQPDSQTQKQPNKNVLQVWLGWVGGWFK